MNTVFLPPAIPSMPTFSSVPAAPVLHGIEVSWARHQGEVREAQKLRFDVFATDMGARLPNTLPGQTRGQHPQRHAV
jgi:putative hemolysin